MKYLFESLPQLRKPAGVPTRSGFANLSPEPSSVARPPDRMPAGFEPAPLPPELGGQGGLQRRRLFTRATITLILTLTAAPSSAQAVAVDRGVRAAGLWCFPLAANPKEYVYLPSTGRLGTDAKGGPEFSFLRFVDNSKPAGGVDTVTDAGGGGVLHFLALYDTPPRQVADAEKALRELVDDTKVRLTRPIAFNAGRYAIVSSLVRSETPGEGGKKMIATGNAPVLEGSKIAVSFGLERRESDILNQSFRTATPDISVVFEMQFSGVTDAFEATLDVDWSEVKKDRHLEAGINTPWFGLDVAETVQRLVKNNAIRLHTRGDSAPTQAMLAKVYDRIVELLFTKTDETPPPPKDGAGLDALIREITGKISYVSFSGAYKVKNIRTGGHTVLRLNHQGSVTRTALISFNIGDLHRRYGKNEAYFPTRNIEDITYKQRDIRIGVDGTLAADFDRYVNSVTVTLRKVHQDGETTLREIVINKETFARSPQGFPVTYGWRGDTDRTAWLDYEYRTRWSFSDGGSRDEDWKKTDNPALNLLPPYERREVILTGDPEALKKAGVRHAVVTLGYDFFGKPRSLRPVVLRVQDGAAEQKVELIQPRGEYRYRYDIQWHLADGKQLTRTGVTDTSGLILVDELPH